MMEGRDPIPRISPDTIVRAGFFPGWAKDLTGWETEILWDGYLFQTINWHEYSHGKKYPECHVAKLNDECVLEIFSLIQGIDRLGIANLNQLVRFDDLELVYIEVPDIGFYASVSAYTFERLAAFEPIAERALAGLKTFRSAWDRIESVSPYTTSMHWDDGP